MRARVGILSLARAPSMKRVGEDRIPCGEPWNVARSDKGTSPNEFLNFQIGTSAARAQQLGPSIRLGILNRGSRRSRGAARAELSSELDQFFTHVTCKHGAQHITICHNLHINYQTLVKLSFSTLGAGAFPRGASPRRASRQGSSVEDPPSVHPFALWLSLMTCSLSPLATLASRSTLFTLALRLALCMHALDRRANSRDPPAARAPPPLRFALWD